jgi:hypothetical protein
MADRQLGYRRGELVHWIQARLASGDPGSWERVSIVHVGDDTITVLRRGQVLVLGSILAPSLAPDLQLKGDLPARLSERWRLLSVSPWAGPGSMERPAGDAWRVGEGGGVDQGVGIGVRATLDPPKDSGSQSLMPTSGPSGGRPRLLSSFVSSCRVPWSRGPLGYTDVVRQ